MPDWTLRRVYNAIAHETTEAPLSLSMAIAIAEDHDNIEDPEWSTSEFQETTDLHETHLLKDGKHVATLARGGAWFNREGNLINPFQLGGGDLDQKRSEIVDDWMEAGAEDLSFLRGLAEKYAASLTPEEVEQCYRDAGLSNA